MYIVYLQSYRVIAVALARCSYYVNPYILQISNEFLLISKEFLLRQTNLIIDLIATNWEHAVIREDMCGCKYGEFGP